MSDEAPDFEGTEIPLSEPLATTAQPEEPSTKPRGRSTAADHRAAYEFWRESGSWAATSKEMGVAYSTPYQWSRADFKCAYGCPWHGWEKIKEDEERVKQATIKLVEAGDATPKEIRKATEALMDEGYQERIASLPDFVARLNALVRPDLERLAHWEYLYGKVFYDLTGIALNYDQMKGNDGTILPPADLISKYAEGLRVNSAEKAIYLLSHIQSQIDAIRIRNLPVSELKPSQSTPSDLAPDEKKGIDDLRKIRELMRVAPTMQVSQILEKVRNGQVIEVSGGPREDA